MTLRLAALVLALALCWPSGGARVMAADWILLPELRMGAEFDSNLNYSFQQRESDYIFKTWPSLDFTRATETSQITGRLALTGLHYFKNSNLDKIDQNYQISSKFQVLPRLGLSFGGSYIFDSTLQEELTASGFVINRTPRQSVNLTPGLTWQTTERNSIFLNYTFNRVNYSDPAFRDYQVQGGTLGATHLLANARTTLQGVATLRNVDYPGVGNRYWILGLAGGLEHKVAEDVSAKLLAGVNLSWFRVQQALLDYRFFPFYILVRQQTQHTFQTSPYVEISATRRFSRTTLTGGFSRTESPSGSGTLFEYYNGYGTVEHAFTERLKASFGGSVYYSNSHAANTDYSNVLWSLNPQMSYQLTEKLTLTSGYRFGYRQDLVGERSTNRHLVWLYLGYRHPLHYQR